MARFWVSVAALVVLQLAACGLPEPGAPGTSSPGEGGATTPGPAAPRTVTLADAGRTVELRVGERFLLDLGEGYDWTVEIADETIVSHVPDPAAPTGTQGQFQANRTGQTELTAVGEPGCRKVTPPCARPSRLVEISLVVLLS
jgi:hypothetical protein